jgi:DNA processing protein
VVIEAGLRSGSLNTAGHAAALGRPVGAVPGPVTSPASAGCHRLLREYDAVCVSNAEQMAELTGWLSSDDGTGRAGVRDSPEETRVIDALSSRRPRTADDVAKHSGLSRRGTLSALGSLGAEGRVEENADGWILRRVPTDKRRVSTDKR